MASEHCRWTSDFLSYWPGLTSGIQQLWKSKKKGKLNCFLENKSICSHVCFNKEGLIIRRLNLIIYILPFNIHTITIQTNMDKYLHLKIWTSDFSSGPVNFFCHQPGWTSGHKVLTERLQ